MVRSTFFICPDVMFPGSLKLSVILSSSLSVNRRSWVNCIPIKSFVPSFFMENCSVCRVPGSTVVFRLFSSRFKSAAVTVAAQMMSIKMLMSVVFIDKTPNCYYYTVVTNL